jgi:hypothetical protein
MTIVCESIINYNKKIIMKTSTSIILAALATVMLVSTVNGHEMFEHKKLVQGTSVPWTAWFSDQFFLFTWVIAAVFIYPIGLICTLFGFPEVYASMYDSVVSGAFSLTLNGVN